MNVDQGGAPEGPECRCTDGVLGVIFMQGRNRDRDLENELVDAAGEKKVVG